MDTLLTMSEAARYLGCSVSSIRNYTKQKGKYNLPCVRTVGQHRKIRQSDLDAFISKHLRLPVEPNTGDAAEQGFCDEPDPKVTYKNVEFDPSNTQSDELFRQQDKKAKAKNATNAGQETKPTTGEILKQLKECFATYTEATNPHVDDTSNEAEGE